LGQRELNNSSVLEAPLQVQVQHTYLEANGALFAWLIDHQTAVLFSRNKPATSNQPPVLFSEDKPAPTISHQPNEQADMQKRYKMQKIDV
jgi:hypothetical protein